MKIYIAHNFAARAYLKGVIQEIEALGHKVTSSWITDDSHLSEKNAVESANTDILDLERADAILLFTDQFSDRPGKGKFVEFGYAIGRNKKLLLYGEDNSCIFYNLLKCKRIKSWGEL